MRFTRTQIPDIVRIEPRNFEDERGFFFENYSKRLFADNGIVCDFVQDNHSASRKGTLRGLHFQKPPMQQAKLVRVAQGEAFDVIVDVRKGSPTYGKHVIEILSAANRRMVYIPEGFAHGFLALKDDTIFLYKVSNYYSAQHDSGLLWSDPDLGIPWPKLDVEYLLSPKDKLHPRLKDL